MTQNPQTAGPTPGWYADPSDPSRQRYWDGVQWTVQTQPAPTTSWRDRGAALLQQGRSAVEAHQTAQAASLAARGILFSFESHTSGRNAHVNIYQDIIEWEQPKGFGGKKDTATLPIVQIVNVGSRADGGHTVMIINTESGPVEFRASRRDTEQARQLLNRLVVQAAHAQRTMTMQIAQPVQSAPAGPVTPTSADQIQQLAALHAQGVLSDAEFAAAKTKVLGI
jgi:hypothetical protein